MTELITKKRDGGRLTKDEIAFIVSGYTCGEIPDYQMSAMLMAMYFNGLDKDETVFLTRSMVQSGETIDLNAASGIKADKHSTGGVGDKTSLVLCPMLACTGVKMAKMSGRGLGHTGGTIDKLESFPGFSCNLSLEKFFETVNAVGMSITGQTANIAPADKLLYALRDVTGTVDVRGLITSSIMSKKLAAGADIIALDVKTGSGGFMKTLPEAEALATEMVQVGTAYGKKTIAVISDMNEPLGNAVGNALEVKEAIETLQGGYAGNLLELCLTLGSCILQEAGIAKTDEDARRRLMQTIESGDAIKKFAQFVSAQGGDEMAVYDTALLPCAPVQMDALSIEEGYVSAIKTDGIGMISLHLGGGRATKQSEIDLGVGLVMNKKIGDYVKAGEALATIHAKTQADAEEASKMLIECYEFTKTAPAKEKFIKKIIQEV